MAADSAAGQAIADVIIIGAGLAGSCAATVLARAGRSVTVVDTQAVHQPEFRAEKLAAVDMAQFERLGLDAAVKAAMTPMDDIRIYRFGELMSRESRREYGFAYSALVNALRASLPSTVNQIICRVASVAAGPDVQTVALADGRVIKGRLLVIATGLGDAVRRMAGVSRVEVAKAHSLCLAFNFATPAAALAFQSLNYFGHRRRDRVGYLSLFPINTVMRANFFVYHKVSDDWTKRFRADPQARLLEMMPEIADICDGFALKGNVEIRQIDLTRSENVRRDGVVLLGDAFCTTCPAPGVGIRRTLTDVERLCTVHLPRWLETPGIGARKIGQFYDDPVKSANDASAMARSVYSRAIVTDDGLVWAARRLRNTLVRRTFLIQAKAVRRFRRLPGLDALRPVQPPARDIRSV